MKKYNRINIYNFERNSDFPSIIKFKCKVVKAIILIDFYSERKRIVKTIVLCKEEGCIMQKRQILFLTGR